MQTHTMFGDGPNLGLVPRVCEELLEVVSKRQHLGFTANLKVSYVEIFGAEVTDLLRGGASIGSSAPAEPWEVDGVDNTFHAHRWVLDGRVDVPVDSVERAMEVIAQGDRCKRRAATAMNARSSRAHALFIISLSQSLSEGGHSQQSSPGAAQHVAGGANGDVVTTKLFLADLGGSEKLSKSQAADEIKSLVSLEGGEEKGRISWKEYYEARRTLQESRTCHTARAHPPRRVPYRVCAPGPSDHPESPCPPTGSPPSLFEPWRAEQSTSTMASFVCNAVSKHFWRGRKPPPTVPLCQPAHASLARRCIHSLARTCRCIHSLARTCLSLPRRHSTRRRAATPKPHPNPDLDPVPAPTLT